METESGSEPLPLRYCYSFIYSEHGQAAQPAVIVLLARHASHDDLGRVLSGRCRRSPLSEQGRSEARRLARAMRGVGLDAVHSSPQQRALETAAIVAEQVRREVHVVTALDEVDFGAWTGCRFDQLSADPLWTQWNSARGSCAPPGGEAMAVAIARAWDHLAAVAHGRAIRTLLCVTHADIIRGLLCAALGKPVDRILELEADPASFAVLDMGRGGTQVLAMNRLAG